MNMCMYLFERLRSIQKLEELNVGMENLGEEVKSLAQQCNGNGNTPASEDNNNPPSVTPEQSRTQGGGVLSSTPQRTVGGRAVPQPNESPVVSQRLVCFAFLCIYFITDAVRVDDDDVFCLLAVGRNRQGVNQVTLQGPCPEVNR